MIQFLLYDIQYFLIHQNTDINSFDIVLNCFICVTIKLHVLLPVLLRFLLFL